MILAMYQRTRAALVIVGLLSVAANATGALSVPFVDGRWSGDVRAGPNTSGVAECWASTTFEDGAKLTLGQRDDGSWYLELSNPGWLLTAPRQQATVIQVDLYPRVEVIADARSRTVLEIGDIGRNALLGQIENGHTITLLSDGLDEKYDLEGSAKVIERIRNCMAG